MASLNGALSLRPTHPRALSLASGAGAVWLWLGACLLLALVVGAAGINHASLWNDELFSRAYEDLFGWSFLFGEGLRIEPTPPTHAVLLHGWMEIFGNSPGAVRSLSLVAFLAGLPGIVLLAREVSGWQAACAAAFLYACNPMAVYFAQEARVYALTLLPAALLLWSVAVLMRHPASRTARCVYAGAATILIYLHASCLFLVASCAACGFAALAVTAGAGRAAALRRWVAMNAVVGVLALPYLIAILSARHTTGLDWMAPLSPALLGSVVTSLFAGPLTPHVLPGAFVTGLVLAAAALSVSRLRAPAPVAVPLIAVPLLFFVLLCLESIHRPVIVARVLCWVTVPVTVLAARSFAEGGRAAKAFAVCLFCANLTGLACQAITPNDGKEPWRDALADAAPLMQAGDLVVLGPHSSALITDAYAPRQRNVWSLESPQTAAITTMIDKRLHVAPIDPASVRARILAGGRVWAISMGFDFPAVDDLKRVSAPAYDRRWRCGRNDCVEVAGWIAPGSVPAHPRPQG